MCIRDSRGAHLQPDARWPRRRRDGIADEARAVHARGFDQAAILVRVAAVDATPGEVDDDICAVQLACPGTEVPGVPGDYTPRRLLRRAAEDDDVMPVGVQRPRENGPNLAGAAGEEDFHRG